MIYYFQGNVGNLCRIKKSYVFSHGWRGCCRAGRGKNLLTLIYVQLLKKVQCLEVNNLRLSLRIKLHTLLLNTMHLPFLLIALFHIFRITLIHLHFLIEDKNIWIISRSIVLPKIDQHFYLLLISVENVPLIVKVYHFHIYSNLFHLIRDSVFYRNSFLLSC